MNAKVAKAIRREVYGDQSQRQERRYTRTVVGTAWSHDRRAYPLVIVANAPGTLRARYQAEKARRAK